MFRFFSRPAPLVIALAFFTFIPVLTALVQVFQIPLGTYPKDSARLAVAPISWFVHVLAGVAFGITGPVQFVRALRHRFGALHRVSGRIFVLSGAILGLSGLSLLAQVASDRTPLADIARGLFGLALLIALALAMAAIRGRNFLRHRTWAIRAYAIGMGLGTVALVFFPIYIITGQPPTGLAADILFVGSWVLTIAFAEVAIRHSSHSSGMGDVDEHATLNVYAKATINDQFCLSTGLKLGAGSSGKGGLLNVGASYGVPLAPATRMGFNVGATLANANYMQDYFGVSAAQASASGYKRYTPASGLRDVTVGLNLQHQISREWMLFTRLNSTSLSNAAKDSPLVRKATSQSAFAAIAYSF